MSDALSITIRRQIRRYLSGELSLRQFTRWLASKMASVEGKAGAEDLAHEVYIRLAEYTNGDWTQDELKGLLRPLVTTYVVTWPAEAGSVQTGTSTSASQSALGFPVAVFPGTGRAAVSA